MANYNVLYRKYRPNTLDEMVGRKNIVKALKNAIEHNRLSHAYLFCGPRGTGKTSLARIFARELNGNIDSEEDIIEIDAASNNGVEEIRNLVDRIKFSPVHGKYKVYIIDEVHMMTQGAFNAFLKTIEEPPSYVIFILATTEPHKILETILSRCQRYDFKSFSDDEIVSRLKFVSEQESINIEEGVFHEIAKLSNGGMRDALSILDQLNNYANSNIKMDDLTEFYSILSSESKQKLIDLILSEKSDETQIGDFINREIKSKNVDYKLLVNDMIEILHKKILEFDDKSKVFKIIDECLSFLKNLSFVKNTNIYFEVFILKCHKLLRLKEDKKIESIVSRETIVEYEEKQLEKYQKVELITYDDDYLLKLLVSADKTVKNEDILKKDLNLSKVMINTNMLRYVTGIKKVNIVASNHSFILVTAKDETVVAEIQKTSQEDTYIKFINTLFEKPKKIHVILEKEFLRIVALFKEKSKLNQLPDKEQLEIAPIIEESKEVEKSSIEKMKELFSDKLIIEKDEE